MKKLKKTEYFTSKHAAFTALNSCVQDAKLKRDNFLAENEESIAKIENEDIKVITGNPSNNHIHNVAVVIRLTYYPKL